ncbi:MAG: phosphoenolpyruvate--protein phosphotransferase [Actinomycetota bacterium]
MVGIVIVSHSRALADGVVELAREMGGTEVALGSAGGTEEPDALGTDAVRVLEAITEAYSDDGVLVLMDLGSAVMSAEMALEMLDEEQRPNVLLCEAPLVEGAVAAATAAKLGRSLEQVAREARGGLAGKQTHLGVELAGASDAIPDASSASEGPAVEARMVVVNPLGLHARPAARLVRTAGDHEARVEVTNLSTKRGPVDATSLNALATLGVTRDHEILVQAWGPGARAAIAALEALAADNFGDPEAVEAPEEVSGRVDPEGGLAGLPASPGIALGPVRRLHRVAPEIPRHETDDVEGEIVRLEAATAAASKEIAELKTQVTQKAGDYEAQIFDAHLLMLEDATFQERARTLIRAERRNAADALWATIERSAREFEALDNERLRERGRDVIDVGERVLAHLLGRRLQAFELAAPGIVVVEELTPSAAAALDPEMVRGVATATGGPTSHGAILARALGVPAVVGVGERILELPDDTAVVVDGDEGVVIVDPAPEEATRYAETARSQAAAAASAAGAAMGPAVTPDGAIIEVAANIGSVTEAQRAVDAGADGVGLLRTEFLFLERSEMPTESEQFESLAAIARALGDRPLTIRTLDVGADKPLRYVRQSQEENPFLGVRGIRLGLAQSTLLKTQLRAVARLARRRALRVMFPMVATVQEFRRAKRLLDDALGDEPPADLEVGIMVEVPSTALTAAGFAPHVDFFSIGTNDLSQYTLAAERGNAAVASLADPLHPAVLRLISETARAAAAHGRWVGVCGEVAGDARAAVLLLGLGVTELSMAPNSIARVKEAVRAVGLDEAAGLAARALECDSASAVRGLLEGEPA